MTDVVQRSDRLSSCPGYWKTWAASTVSAFGSYVSILAIQVLIVVTLHGGATEVGAVNAARVIGAMGRPAARPTFCSVCLPGHWSTGFGAGRCWCSPILPAVCCSCSSRCSR